jgi:hypothetical protein
MSTSIRRQAALLVNGASPPKFVPSASNKFTVSPRSNLKYNPDGSLTLNFQNCVPGRRQGSQLATRAEGRIDPNAKMYLPKEMAPSILNGTWKLPAVVKVG